MLTQNTHVLCEFGKNKNSGLDARAKICKTHVNGTFFMAMGCKPNRLELQCLFEHKFYRNRGIRGL